MKNNNLLIVCMLTLLLLGSQVKNAHAQPEMVDSDTDGVLDDQDYDDDNDGILDDVILGEGDEDMDGDSFPNRLDLDSDGDGILDLHEAAFQRDYTTPLILPASGVFPVNQVGDDGIFDGIQFSELYAPSFAINDTDGDGNPDYLDRDSDNEDSEDNNVPIVCPVIVDTLTDTDNDGIHNNFDSDDTTFGGPSICNVFGLPGQDNDLDNDLIPDTYDGDEDGPGAGDSDNDGFPDDHVEECLSGWPCGHTSYATPDYMSPDTDGDGHMDGADNCPSMRNDLQRDTDQDEVGNGCDLCLTDGGDPVRDRMPMAYYTEDMDNDLIGERCDNCTDVSNEWQKDDDGDGVGNACDVDCVDEDHDEACDDNDNCPEIYNPDQMDLDNDGLGTACDSDEDVITPPPPPPPPPGNDQDFDGVLDDDDNCVDIYNPDQADRNNDGVGDACTTLPPPPGMDNGCGCSSSTTPGIGGLMLMMLVLLFLFPRRSLN
jgi:MYXO-CTERM domain-containing protein